MAINLATLQLYLWEFQIIKADQILDMAGLGGNIVMIVSPIIFVKLDCVNLQIQTQNKFMFTVRRRIGGLSGDGETSSCKNGENTTRSYCVKTT